MGFLMVGPAPDDVLGVGSELGGGPEGKVWGAAGCLFRCFRT